MDILKSYEPEKVFVGTGGFTGYHAFLFKKTCFLENGNYGNATYIIPKDNWEKLSQLSKNELLETKELIEKVVHNSDWEEKIKYLMLKVENL